jgi:hypothetical protein
MSDMPRSVAAAALAGGGRVGVVRNADELLGLLDAWRIPRAGRLRASGGSTLPRKPQQLIERCRSLLSPSCCGGYYLLPEGVGTVLRQLTPEPQALGGCEPLWVAVQQARVIS